MALPLTGEIPSRAMGFRRFFMGAAVACVIAGIGLGGFIYYRNNSPHQLAIKAELALEQHDPGRAVEFLTRAINKHPTGQNDIAIHNLLAKALIQVGREEDARQYLQEQIAHYPDNVEALDLLAESYVHPAFRKYQEAVKPITPDIAADLYKSINQENGQLEKLPKTPRNEIAQAELQNLYSVVLDGQLAQAVGALNVARVSQDGAAIAKAQERVDALQKDSVEAHRARSLKLLRDALAQDPKNAHGSSLLAQYLYDDKQYKAALAVYEEMKQRDAVSRELALTTANVLIADTDREPVEVKRMADAQAVLEAYLKTNPKDPRILVAIGEVLLVQNKSREATKMAEQANAAAPGDLDAQILLINCRLTDDKPADALNLINPLINSHSNVPQIWYLLGKANFANADYKDAIDAYRKALALDPNYHGASRELLLTELKAGENEAAAALASQMIQNDRYYMPAWDVVLKNLRKNNQVQRAQNMLTSLARDPNLPSEQKPTLISLLIDYGQLDAAQSLLATLKPTDKNAVLLSAELADRRGNDAQARVLMAKAVQQDPDDPDLRLQYADMLQRDHFLPDARAQLDLLAKQKLTTNQSLDLARAYLALRLPQQAAALTHDVLSKQPKSAAALALDRQANAMLNGGAAATQPASVASADPSSVEDLIANGNAALKARDFTKALTLARTGLAKNPNSARLHELSAFALAGLQQYDQAVNEIVTVAQAAPSALSSFRAFVHLFPDANSAAKGLTYASRLASVNPSLANWAMGQLAETTGNPDLALHYYGDGIAAANNLADPTSAKGLLYAAVLQLHTTRKDPAAVKKAADEFARDPNFAVGTRLFAAEDLLQIGDRAAAQHQLELMDGLVSNHLDPDTLLRVAGLWVNVGNPDHAQAFLQKQVDAGNKDPKVLSVYAGLLERTNPDRAVKIAQELVKQDPTNPRYLVALASVQAADGHYADAFRTIDDTRSLGATGRQLADAERLHLLISAGLFKEASDELASHNSATNDDFQSMLAIGQGWAHVNKPDEARKILSAIPPYAGQYPAARVSLASLELDANHADQAVKILEDLRSRFPGASSLAAGPLFQAYIRDGKPEAALELARSQQALAVPNTRDWRNATLLAAAAAREARQYDTAVQLLQSLDAQSQKAAALDMTLLELLQHNPRAAQSAIDQLTDAAPVYNHSTMSLLAGAGKPDARLLKDGAASTVYATLTAMSPDQRKAALPALQSNPNLLPGDAGALLSEAAASTDPASTLRQLAFTQRLLEAGWTSSVLDQLDALDKSMQGHVPTLALVQRYEALTNLQHTAEAAHVRDLLAARLQQSPDVALSVRVLLANADLQQERYSDALSLLQPLEKLNRPAILTTLATIHEKLGQLDEAIALHRKVRQLDPSNVVAANNLAYTLAAAHPNDKAALAEAAKAIDFAIAQHPEVTAFQDTKGWIEILSGQAADGTHRLARAITTLRLDPAVHYHLGIGYSKLGDADLARLHLQDVEYLAETQHNIPELPLATAALKTLATTTTTTN